ncbi:MAG: N-acetylmuramoyl-L-alanine amidase [Candidatus Zixiibacteriota bacterium]
MNRIFAQLLLFVCITTLALSSSVGAMGTITVETETGDHTVAAYYNSGVEYISLSEFADYVDGSLDWEIIGQKIVYTDKKNQLSFFVDSPYCQVNDETYNLTYAAAIRDGELFLPAVTFLPILDKVAVQRISYDKKKSKVKVQPNRYNVNDVAFSAKANGLLIEVACSQELAFDVFVTTGNWVNISIRDAKLNVAKIESRKDSRYMYDIKAHQEDGVGQISIWLKQDVKSTQERFVQDPQRIQISIPDVKFAVDQDEDNPKSTFDGKIDVIAIDPGHGGQDFGAIGAEKTREKDVTLAIATELADIITKDGRFKVVMTRNNDKTLTLQDRADCANKAKADLFVSIHANANPSKKARGWNIFFLAPAKNDSACATEQFENSYFVKELTGDSGDQDNGNGPSNDDPVAGILNEMLLTEFQSESHDFAMMIDKEFRRNLDIPARGVDQAGFFVLNKVFTPSVLVETAFITNKTDAKLLRSDKFQKSLAQGIYDAIEAFADKYDRDR